MRPPSCMLSPTCEGRYRLYTLSYILSLLLGSAMYDRCTQLDKTLKRKGVGGQRWSDSSEDPETSLFGFARMPSIIDAVEGKSTSELRVELEERAEAVVISVC